MRWLKERLADFRDKIVVKSHCRRIAMIWITMTVSMSRPLFVVGFALNSPLAAVMEDFRSRWS